jgi:protein SCO1/2
MKPALHFLFIAVLTVLAACGPSTKDGFRGSDISRVEWGGDFSLTAHTGKVLNTESLRGKVQVIFFGYTHCPDICAPTLAKLDKAMAKLGPEAADVQVLFVTVDPRHDTVRRLAGFVPKFNSRFLGLTGLPEQIEVVAKDYKVAYGSRKAGGTLDHFGGLLLKDRQGKVRVLLREQATVDDIVNDIRLLLRTPAPGPASGK